MPDPMLVRICDEQVRLRQEEARSRQKPPNMENQDQLIRVLQTAISPVVLISGIGLLVL